VSVIGTNPASVDVDVDVDVDVVELVDSSLVEDSLVEDSLALEVVPASSSSPIAGGAQAISEISVDRRIVLRMGLVRRVWKRRVG